MRLSGRAYAQHRDISHTAVQQAIRLVDGTEFKYFKF